MNSDLPSDLLRGLKSEVVRGVLKIEQHLFIGDLTRPGSSEKTDEDCTQGECKLPTHDWFFLRNQHLVNSRAPTSPKAHHWN